MLSYIHTSDDYLASEFRHYVDVLGKASDISAPCTVLLRYLLRVRRLAFRVALTVNRLGMRSLSGLIADGNPYVLLLRSHQLLADVQTDIDAVVTIVQLHKMTKGCGIYHISALWAAIGKRLSYSWAELINSLVDANDVFARLAEFYFSRSGRRGYETIGDMCEAYYGHKHADDVFAPGDSRCERPLRDLTVDLYNILRFNRCSNQVVVDYGAGLGRTRHYFYSRDRLLPQPATYLMNAVTYICMEVSGTETERLLRLRVNDFPNGRHAVDADSECAECRRHSDRDLLIIIDPEKEGTVINCYSMNVSANSEMWEKPVFGTFPEGADVIVLVNVLHEVPMNDLPVLIANIERLVKPGGIVLIYEMLGPKTIEHSYVVWRPEDIFIVFSRFGFSVLAIPGRIGSDSKSSWGYPYLLACLLRQAEPVRTAHEIKHHLLPMWQERIAVLLRRIDALTGKLSSGLATDADRFEHLHAMHSLISALRQTL